jgi:hypothetical protein
MKRLLIIYCIILPELLRANEHSLGSHEHGAIKLGMAIEKNHVEIDLDGPTESFISFEYLPKSEKEKKVFNDLKNIWEKELFKLIAFDKKLNCVILESHLNQIIDQKETVEFQKNIKNQKKKEAGVHSDIEAKAKIKCNANLSETIAIITLKKQFRKIKKLAIDLISNETKTIEINQEIQSITL